MNLFYLHKVLEAGVKPVELTGKEIKMIKKREHYKGNNTARIIGAVIFAGYGIISLIEDFTNILWCIFCMFLAWILLKMFLDSLHMKIEYAFYGTVSKKEIRYSVLYSRCTPAVKQYSDTVDEESKQNRARYYYISVMINGIEYDGICCYDSEFKKIEEGNEVIIAKGLSIYDEPIVYKK